MRIIHLIALIFGALTFLCAIIAISGVNKGWFKAGFDFGLIKVSGGGQTVKLDDLCDGMGGGGKATLAIVAIALVVRFLSFYLTFNHKLTRSHTQLSFVGTIIILLRFLGVLESRGLSILAAVMFIFCLIAFVVAIGVYTGYFLDKCCRGGCSADGGYACTFLFFYLPSPLLTCFRFSDL